MKECLSIVVVATNKENTIKTLDSIFAAEIKKKTKIYLIYAFGKDFAEKLELRYKDANPLVGIKSKAIKYENEYFPDWVKGFGFWRSLIAKCCKKRKVEPYKKVEWIIKQLGYWQCADYVKGKYIMYIPEGCCLKKDFWENSMELLFENKKVCNYIGFIDFGRKMNAEFIAELYNDTFEIYESNKGITEYVHIRNLMNVIYIVKRRKVRTMIKKTIYCNNMSERIMFDRSVITRMNFTPSMIQRKAIAEVNANDEYGGCFLKIEQALLRIMFLIDWIEACKKFKKTKQMKKCLHEVEVNETALSEGLKAYKKSLLEISEYYKQKGEDETSERFRHLSNMIA